MFGKVPGTVKKTWAVIGTPMIPTHEPLTEPVSKTAKRIDDVVGLRGLDPLRSFRY
jgi:hypothetical protein